MAITPDEMPKVLWDALRSMGVPEQTIELTLTMRVGDAVTIACTFYPNINESVPEAERLAEATKTFLLVEREPEATPS